jgi:hypothetical protein
MKTTKTKKSAKAPNMRPSAAKPGLEAAAMVAPIRKRVVRLRLSTGRPVGESPRAAMSSAFAAAKNGDNPTGSITINSMAAYEVWVALDPVSSSFSPIRDDEDYDKVTYGIESFGNIDMTAKADGKIECKIALTLKPNGIA